MGSGQRPGVRVECLLLSHRSGGWDDEFGWAGGMDRMDYMGVIGILG